MHTPTTTAVRAEPNVTPMIDVMLVLLIIFMVVAPMLLNPEHATLPVAANLRSHPEERANHTLTIDMDGRYTLDHGPATLAELPGRLAAIYSASEDHVLFIRADQSLDYSKVLDAINLARENGVKVVGLIARPILNPPRSSSPRPSQ